MDNDNKIKPLLGTFELALFMAQGVERFPVTVSAAKRSFAIPIILLFLWVYPLYLVPTEVLGQRGYGELITIHGSILVLHLAVFCTLLWFIAQKLGKIEYFWSVVTMNNYVSIISFIMMLPLFIMVITGHHSWDDVFGGLLLISFYELALTAYVITRGLNVPWQFGTGLAFLSMFIWDGASTTIFALSGIH